MLTNFLRRVIHFDTRYWSKESNTSGRWFIQMTQEEAQIVMESRTPMLIFIEQLFKYEPVPMWLKELSERWFAMKPDRWEKMTTAINWYVIVNSPEEAQAVMQLKQDVLAMVDYANLLKDLKKRKTA